MSRLDLVRLRAGDFSPDPACPSGKRLNSAVAFATFLGWFFFIFSNGVRGAEISHDFFETRIRPLLIENCYECHSAEKKTKGGLRLDSREGWAKGGDSGPALVPGQPEKSLVMKAVRYEDPDLQMPPKRRLSSE